MDAQEKTQKAQDRDFAVPVWLLGSVAVFGAVMLWAYWTSLGEIVAKWSNDPQYSHGFLVPVFAAVFLWLKRETFPTDSLATNWWGIPLLVAAAALRLAGTYYYYSWFDHLSLIPMIAGAVLTIGGWRTLRWAGSSIFFLLFMIPLPYRLEGAMALPLQRVATVASTYILQTVGVPAIAEGNVIVLDEMRIDVVDACSGLRMLVVFFALSVAVTMLFPRAHWENAVIILSATPIAIASNVVRITVTGVFHMLGMSTWANFVHDHAEWLMMPLALGMLWLVVLFLSHLFFVPEEERPIGFGLSSPTNKDRVTATGPAASAKSAGA